MELILEDGSVFSGRHFGYKGSVAGEVIFNTGMVGYPETLTDPSYKGQILVLTFPLIGNYGIPDGTLVDQLHRHFESEKIHLSGIVITSLTREYSHWNAVKSLEEWMIEYKIPGLEGVDTRAITKRLRDKGTQLGKLVFEGHDLPFVDPTVENLVAQVSCKEPVLYAQGAGKKRVILVDNGCKNNIIRNLIQRGVEVLRVPWNYDYTNEKYDGVFLSNGPGDPVKVDQGLAVLKKQLVKPEPLFGICMGHQLLGLATGAQTYKLKFGHHSQNQPCVLVGTKRCFITSQNHNYAIDDQTLPDDFRPWFFNANDGSSEGIIHTSKPQRSVQFHPESWPGPVDTRFLFDEFVSLL
ncbi:MAG: carbamoyl phosphate synthase small subunit [Candidatus Lambdaproteobacteria bacterium RIFOXYD1_FULL_56_27]|uniref:Carbamoyl phosphate synthase small chain n=1 Tax=Candidatus Lambdaproteobacteria bacterium RIFOXYD2_FULL_56_26 TaxID=1817773 RepID=A0A1F6H1K4_9PROT|nr:MAG: carbamoyl phosphate synthase small subunit [Candidatus Lambdaproteobacteria bacterium RIFOXYD2_FULL_56_26]OGH05704.1 MAG: carbamoyl phosphate synthase small subunit [Candidatus Lambdaproteobacteria bacterium RIFOXYC1_FULL_56_13]OGH08429.1 MAG: carbamoyl phosphate synthase small subunit [Candidatus Lambdaproteobacteria bacterium RIFOXYD1_FULL_56_27]